MAPEAEGHGTDAVIAAYHDRKGLIRYRVPIVKTFASALTIGTGGSGGPEGPITQIGAGFGYFLANVFRFSPADRRVLMAAGMGAGIAAILRAPLAGALFAAEVLYWSPEFEPEVLMPAGLASVASYCTFGCFFQDGWRPLFDTPHNLAFNNPWQLGPYLLLAVCMILLAAVYTRSFYGFTHLFHRTPIPRWVKPAVGAGLTGATALALYFGFEAFGYARGGKYALSVLSFGYGSLQGVLNGDLMKDMNDHALVAAAVLAAVALGKIATTGLTIGSGGSGGVFSPSIVIGGCGGGALGLVLKVVLGGVGLPQVAPEPAAFALVGMAGFFAAAAKTPFSILVIVSEMTGNYDLILPTVFVCTLAFLFSDRQSLYQNQVMSRSMSPAHQGAYVREVLTGLQVRLFLDPDWEGPVLHPEEPATSVAGRFGGADHDILPVVDAEPRLSRRGEPGRDFPGHPIEERRAAAADGRPDAHGRDAVAAGRRPGPGDGTVRGERPAGAAGGGRGDQTGGRRGETARRGRRLPAPAARTEECDPDGGGAGEEVSLSGLVFPTPTSDADSNLGDPPV